MRVLGKNSLGKSPRKKYPQKKNWLRFSVATFYRFVARFARVRIEDSSRNRFALNGIQRDFSGGILSGYHLRGLTKRQSDSIINIAHLFQEIFKTI